MIDKLLQELGLIYNKYDKDSNSFYIGELTKYNKIAVLVAPTTSRIIDTSISLNKLLKLIKLIQN